MFETAIVTWCQKKLKKNIQTRLLAVLSRRFEKNLDRDPATGSRKICRPHREMAPNQCYSASKPSDTTTNLHLQCSDTFETRPSWWLGKKLEKVAANVESVRNDHRLAIETKWLSNRNLYYVYRTRSHRNTLWGLPFASEEEKGRMDKVLELWNNYCIDKANTIYERYKFPIRAQEPEAWRLYLLALLSCLHAYAFSLRRLLIHVHLAPRKITWLETDSCIVSRTVDSARTCNKNRSWNCRNA